MAVPVAHRSENHVLFRRAASPAKEKKGPGGRLAVRAALVVIALLSVGCIGEPEATPSPPADVATDDASTRPITEQFAGTSTGTPNAPDEQVFEFTVPRGAVGVNGTLAYERPPADIPLGLGHTFEFQLLDPSGEVIAEGYPDVEGHLIVATIEPPKPGVWTFVVRGTATVNTPFTVDAVAELIVPKDNVVAKTLTLGQRSFYEVNLILEKDAAFRFSFNASAPVAWDVHSHPPEGVKYWEEGEGATGGAEFTAPSRDVYSILWENPGALPADLEFEIHGTFRMHSHSG